jgi:hypothetical protein
MGRRAHGDGLKQTTPLIRIKPWDLTAAGVERVGRTSAIREGRPQLDDGRTLSQVSNVIWSTGYSPGFEWIDLPIHGEDGPMQARGVVATQPGLCFVGLHFQYALSSSMVHGVSRDAQRIAQVIAASASRALPRARGGSRVMASPTVRQTWKTVTAQTPHAARPASRRPVEGERLVSASAVEADSPASGNRPGKSGVAR